MATLNISSNIAIGGLHAGTSVASTATQRLLTLAYTLNFTDGTGYDKAQKVAVGTVTDYVGTYTLDLETITQYDGSLFNPNYLKIVYFKNNRIPGTDIVVGGTAMEVLVAGLGNIGMQTYDDMVFRCRGDYWDVSAGKTFLIGAGTVSFDYILVAS